MTSKVREFINKINLGEHFSYNGKFLTVCNKFHNEITLGIIQTHYYTNGTSQISYTNAEKVTGPELVMSGKYMGDRKFIKLFVDSMEADSWWQRTTMEYNYMTLLQESARAEVRGIAELHNVPINVVLKSDYWVGE